MIITPQFGLFFWSAIIFLLFFVLLRRFAWKPILTALKQREDTIENALQEAAKARTEMEQLKADNEALIKEAKVERDQILRDANAMRQQIIDKAKQEAEAVATKEAEKAKQQIEAEKLSALNEIKDTVSVLAVEVAEKILRKELSNKAAQESFAKELISQLSEN